MAEQPSTVYRLGLLKALKREAGTLRLVNRKLRAFFFLCLEKKKLTSETGTYLYPVSVIIQQQHARARHLLGLHHRLQISQQTHVFGHISGQNLGNDDREERYEKRYPRAAF